MGASQIVSASRDKDGLTTLIFRDGSIYRGETAGADRNGRGRMLYPDGSWFDGTWLDDKKHGEGLFCAGHGADGGGGALGNGTDGGGDGGMGALTAPVRQRWTHGELEVNRWSTQLRTASSEEGGDGDRPGVGKNDEGVS